MRKSQMKIIIEHCGFFFFSLINFRSLTAREKRNIQKFNSDVELQAYEKRLKDIEKKIRVLVKRGKTKRRCFFLHRLIVENSNQNIR